MTIANNIILGQTDNSPAEFFQNTVFFKVSMFLSFITMPIRTITFYSQLLFRKGEVYRQFVNRILSFGRKPDLLKSLRHGFFNTANPRPCPSTYLGGTSPRTCSISTLQAVTYQSLFSANFARHPFSRSFEIVSFRACQGFFEFIRTFIRAIFPLLRGAIEKLFSTKFANILFLWLPVWISRPRHFLGSIRTNSGAIFIWITRKLYFKNDITILAGSR